MTKKEYCIHKMEEVVQGKLFFPSPALIFDTFCDQKRILVETDVVGHYVDFLHAPGN